MIDFSISGTQLILALVGVVGAVLLLIMLFKNYFKSSSAKDLGSKYQEKGSSSSRTKYPEVDIFSYRSQFLTMGLIASLGLMILAFSYSPVEEEVVIPDGYFEMDEEIEMEPPRTAEPPPPPPPPPPPVIEEVPDEVEIEDEPIFEDQTLDEETVIEAEPVDDTPPPPPPPPPPAPKEEEIFKVVEDMPMFPGCEKKKKDDRKKCSESKLFKYLSKNLEYPTMASENGIQGRVIVGFVVGKDGSISDVKVLRGIGGGCDEAAKEVIENMPKWNPGKQRGRPVKVQYTLPVIFKLE